MISSLWDHDGNVGPYQHNRRSIRHDNRNAGGIVNLSAGDTTGPEIIMAA
jgi:hypothetical protein